MYKCITATCYGHWSPKTGKGAFAVWIRGDFGTYKEGALLRINNEMGQNDNYRHIMANIAAIGNTLHIVDELMKETGNYFELLIINNRCSQAHDYINKKIETGALVSDSAATILRKMLNKQKSQNPSKKAIEPNIQLRLIQEVDFSEKENLAYVHSWLVNKTHLLINNQIS